MKNYYILSVDSFMNAFSMTDTTTDIKFSFEKSGISSVLNSINPGDQVFVYRKYPINKINILLEVTESKEFRKKLEVLQGAALDGINLKQNPEDEELVNISENDYKGILKRLLNQEWFSSDSDSIETDEITRITGAENVLLYGVPGVGKSFAIKEQFCDDPERMERVVFHPDYTYSDFVGQILPRVVGGQLKYVFTPGPFTKLLKKAWKNPGQKFYLVIEEINRGNAPAIFGEIFQLLDRKDADNHKYKSNVWGESEYGITNYEVAEEVFGDEKVEIKIPSNMWVLATMNTSDQNVFTLDTAFQRRWNMKHIKNDIMSADHSKQKIEGTAIGWGAFATVINDIVAEINIDMAGTEDKRLGAYFIKASELNSKLFPEKVLKYLWDDVFKMEKDAVFEDKFKTLEMVIDEFEHCESDKLQAVLRADVYKKMLDTTLK